MARCADYQSRRLDNGDLECCSRDSAIRDKRPDRAARGATVTTAPGATLDLNNNTGVTLAAIAGFGNVNVGANGLTLGAATSVFMGSLQGSGAINVSAGTFDVTGNSSAFTGNWNINGGIVRVNSNNALGTGTVNIGASSGTTGATLTVATNGAVTTIPNNIVITNGSTGTMVLQSTVTATNISVEYAGSLTINKVTGTSGLTLGGGFSSTATPTGACTISGNISGPGSIFMDSGNWNFNGNNSGWSGGMQISAGNAQVIGLGTDTALGTGTLAFTSTSFGLMLRADNGARTIANNITSVAGSNRFGITGKNDLTFNGTLTLQTAASLDMQISNVGTTTFANTISGVAGAGISQNGFGTLVLSGANTFTGNYNFNSGVLGLGSDSVGGPITNGPVGTGTLVINAVSSNGAVLPRSMVRARSTIRSPSTATSSSMARTISPLAGR